ncbi:MAG TPA: hypothetical protein VI731_02070 [Bacteroidia bacterium]|nr:hypothetical protein [Bacteroidia bacterium]
MKAKSLLLYPAAILVFTIGGAAFQAVETCDTKALKDKAKAALDPYKYDSGKVTHLYYKKKEQIREVMVPVFIGEKYRFVFNNENLSRAVEVKIFNKDKESKNRKELHSFTAGPGGEQLYSWEPSGAKQQYYVDYNIPATSDSTAFSECVVLMIGYKK